MIINKNENIDNTNSEGEAKGEDEQHGKLNQQGQKYQKVFPAETKTKEKEKENQGGKTSTRVDENKNTSKTNKLGTRHSKLHQENLVN